MFVDLFGSKIDLDEARSLFGLGLKYQENLNASIQSKNYVSAAVDYQTCLGFYVNDIEVFNMQSQGFIDT